MRCKFCGTQENPNSSVCIICGNADFSDEVKVQCPLCKNLSYMKGVCCICQNDGNMAEIVTQTFPWQGPANATRFAARQVLFHYIRAFNVKQYAYFKQVLDFEGDDDEAMICPDCGEVQINDNFSCWNCGCRFYDEDDD